MKGLPKGMFQRAGRAGFYTRVWERDPRRPRGGKEKWICLGTELTEATQRLEEIQRDGIRPDLDGNMAMWARQWLETYVIVHRTQRGRELAAVRVERYLKPFMGRIQARKLSKDDLRRYRLHLERLNDPPLRPQTVAHILSDARCLAHWLEDVGVVSRAPIPDRLLPKIEESPPKGLSDEEQAAICSLPDPHGFACRVMLGSGVRWGELTRLQASDLKDGALMIHGPTKSRRMRRVPLSDTLAREIRSRVGKLAPFGEASSGSFSRTVRRLAGVPDFHVHRCRHSFAYSWLRNGGAITTLQRVLGHADLCTTMRYGRPDDALINEDAARVHSRRVS